MSGIVQVKKNLNVDVVDGQLRATNQEEFFAENRESIQKLHERVDQSNSLEVRIAELEEENKRLRCHNERMREGWIQRDVQIERLDEAMASPERIAENTAMVGGFVSTLDLIETDEQIINRAIAIIKAAQNNGQ